MSEVVDVFVSIFMPKNIYSIPYSQYLTMVFCFRLLFLSQLI